MEKSKDGPRPRRNGSKGDRNEKTVLPPAPTTLSDIVRYLTRRSSPFFLTRLAAWQTPEKTPTGVRYVGRARPNVTTRPPEDREAMSYFSAPPQQSSFLRESHPNHASNPPPPLLSLLRSAQFFLCTSETAWLNGKHVVFGSVIEGMDVIKTIESYGSQSGATKAPVVVAACGQLS
jgi:hypothetical protein